MGEAKSRHQKRRKSVGGAIFVFSQAKERFLKWVSQVGLVIGWPYSVTFKYIYIYTLYKS